MKSWFIECTRNIKMFGSVNNYDYDFEVKAETEEDALKKLNDYWYENEMDGMAVYKVHKPTGISDVTCVREPHF